MYFSQTLIIDRLYNRSISVYFLRLLPLNRRRLCMFRSSLQITYINNSHFSPVLYHVGDVEAEKYTREGGNFTPPPLAKPDKTRLGLPMIILPEISLGNTADTDS